MKTRPTPFFPGVLRQATADRKPLKNDGRPLAQPESCAGVAQKKRLSPTCSAAHRYASERTGSEAARTVRVWFAAFRSLAGGGGLLIDSY